MLDAQVPSVDRPGLLRIGFKPRSFWFDDVFNVTFWEEGDSGQPPLMQKYTSNYVRTIRDQFDFESGIVLEEDKDASLRGLGALYYKMVMEVFSAALSQLVHIRVTQPYEPFDLETLVETSPITTQLYIRTDRLDKEEVGALLEELVATYPYKDSFASDWILLYNPISYPSKYLPENSDKLFFQVVRSDLLPDNAVFILPKGGVTFHKYRECELTYYRRGHIINGSPRTPFTIHPDQLSATFSFELDPNTPFICIHKQWTLTDRIQALDELREKETPPVFEELQVIPQSSGFLGSLEAYLKEHPGLTISLTYNPPKVQNP